MSDPQETKTETPPILEIKVVGPITPAKLRASAEAAAKGDPKLEAKLLAAMEALIERNEHAAADQLSRRLHRFIKHVEEVEPSTGLYALIECLANLAARYLVVQEGMTQEKVDQTIIDAVAENLKLAREYAATSPAFRAECAERKAEGLPYPAWMDAVLAAPEKGAEA